MALSEPGHLRHRLITLLRQFRLRLEEMFDHAWAIVPSQPILNLFIFAATITVMAVDAPPISFERLGVGPWVFATWCVLGIAGPLGVLGSHQLILHCRGRKRLFGFWLRFACDTMLAVALAAYLVSRLLTPNDDSTLYGLVIITGVWLLQLLWIVRDVWALVLIERTATRLNSIVYER